MRSLAAGIPSPLRIGRTEPGELVDGHIMAVLSHQQRVATEPLPGRPWAAESPDPKRQSSPRSNGSWFSTTSEVLRAPGAFAQGNDSYSAESKHYGQTDVVPVCSQCCSSDLSYPSQPGQLQKTFARGALGASPSVPMSVAAAQSSYVPASPQQKHLLWRCCRGCWWWGTQCWMGTPPRRGQGGRTTPCKGLHT